MQVLQKQLHQGQRPVPVGLGARKAGLAHRAPIASPFRQPQTCEAPTRELLVARAETYKRDVSAAPRLIQHKNEVCAKAICNL